MSRQYLQQVPYKSYTLAEWLCSLSETPGKARQVHRWDVLDRTGNVVQTFSDRAHAESYVDHHAAR